LEGAGAALGWFGGEDVAEVWGWPAAAGAKQAIGAEGGLVWVDGARDDEDSGFGRVMSPVEIEEVGCADGSQVVWSSENWISIGVAFVTCEQVFLFEASRGRVEFSGTFLGDHSSLAIDFALDESWVGQSIGFEFESEGPVVGRKGEPIMGEIFGGFGVGLAGGAERESIDAAFGKSAGSQKEHMLKKVSDTRSAWRVIDGPRGNIEIADDDGRAL
jgi:hypothetical protein